MASPPEQPWSDYEKNHLLAEIIKAHNPQPGILFDVITRLNIQQPRWNDIPFPPDAGRSLNSSQKAYEKIRQSMPPHLGPVMGARPQTPMNAPAPMLKRPFYEGHYSSGPSGGREIRPKPSTPGASMPQPSPTEHPPKRKRGRPTKAEALAKAEAAGVAPGAESLPSPTRQFPPMTQGPMATPAREVKHIAPATSGMTIAAMLTPVQGSQKSASQSGSSSGKRRRARSTKSEPDDGLTAASSAPGLDPYESPYARMGFGTGIGIGPSVGGSGEGERDPESAPPSLAAPRYRDEPPSPPRTAAPTETAPPTERPPTRSSPPHRQ